MQRLLMAVRQNSLVYCRKITMHSLVLLLLLWVGGTSVPIVRATAVGGGGDEEDDGFVVDYNTNAGPVQGKLNVHLVSHTHNDLGWLKTVDQCFLGTNSSIQASAVRYILDSVVAALQEDPNRKFIYVETGFFARWWREQKQKKKEIVRRLVASGQLEFINGGWCMHDEAAPSYIEMIDQTSLGHRFLMKEFGIMPRIGWQIDPFGHSAVQAYLLSAEVGFDALYFGRADYQDIENRRKHQTMEMVWRGSKSHGSSAQIFTGILPNLYDPPPGFDSDIQTTKSVIQDDPFLSDYNVKERINAFVDLAMSQSKEYRTNHIIWTMGEDFAYESADTWFSQLDRIIHYVNKDGRVNAFYSTPSIYTEQKFAANYSWPLKTDDFFPYADYSNAYWTGYFTSRSALKGYIRKLSGFLQAARQLEFIIGRQKKGHNTYALDEALAVAMHHDAIAGTSKQHVANDYAKRLSLGYEEASGVINSALVCLMSGKLNLSCNNKLSMDTFASQAESEGNSGKAIKLVQCPLLNISYCPVSETKLGHGDTLVVAIYNGLGWKRSELVNIPVTNADLHVFDPDGNEVEAQIVPVDMPTRRIRELSTHSNTKQPIYNIYFEVSVPAHGYAVYSLKASKTILQRSSMVMLEHVQGQTNIDSGKLKLIFSDEVGLLNEIRDLERNVSIPIEQSLCWYNASDGHTSKGTNEAAGAYVFRPNSTTCFPLGIPGKKVLQSVIRGNVLSQVHQQFSPWASQIIRLYKNAKDAEIEFLIGPIPIQDNLGKEIITRFITNIQSNQEFFTDSNGRDFIQRKRNYRSDWDLQLHEVIAGNYYPLNLGIYIKDNITEFSVLVDRPVGGSSISDGQLEVMLHRRLLHDDNKGVDENLNETVCFDNNRICEGLTIKGKIHLGIHSTDEASEWRRTKGQKLLLPLVTAFAVVPHADVQQIDTSKYSMMAEGYELPPNVAVITLQELEDGKILLRLAHIYEVNENSKFSAPAFVDLHKIFHNTKVKSISEMNLSGVKVKSELRRLNFKVEEGHDFSQSSKRTYKDRDSIIELMPMEIRTFVLELEK